MENRALDNLVVPIYLDEEIVIDLLAIMEDGFYTVKSLTETESRNESRKDNADFGANTNTILKSLISISASWNYQKGNEKTEKSEAKYNKIHTLTSLFAKLRRLMIEKNTLEIISPNTEVKDIQLGSFVEIKGQVNKSPFIDILEKSKDAIKISVDFSNLSSNDMSNSKNKNKNTLSLISKLDNLLNELKSSEVESLYIDGPLKTILTVKEKYISHDSFERLQGGSFRVLGKVVKIETKSKESLLRNTPLAILSPREIEHVLVSSFSSMDKSALDFPELKVEIDPPVIVIIPIAIYA